MSSVDKSVKEDQIKLRMVRAIDMAFSAYKGSSCYKNIVYLSNIIGPAAVKIYDELKELEEK